MGTAIAVVLWVGIPILAAFGWLRIGISYSRRIAPAVYQQKLKEERKEASYYDYRTEEEVVRYARRDTKEELYFAVWFWPIYMVMQWWKNRNGAFGDYLLGSVEDDWRRLNEVGTDINRWKGLLVTGSGEERAAAQAVIPVLEETQRTLYRRVHGKAMGSRRKS